MHDVKHIDTPDDRTDEDNGITLVWGYTVCTDNSASAFNRLSKAVERSSSKRVILDMRKCRYLNVAGLRCLLEWNADLIRQDVELKISGLSPVLARIFRLSRLSWLLLDSE